MTLLLLLISGTNLATADINVEKEMTAIRKNGKYIYGEFRGADEAEAKEEAMKILIDNISSYLKEQDKNIPETVIVPKIASVSESLSTFTSSNRARVLLYVEKSTILALDGSQESLVLAKNSQGSHYENAGAPSAPTQPTLSDRQKDAVSQIMSSATQTGLAGTLKKLRAANIISGAAAFPVDSLDDYFVAVVSPDNKVMAVLRCNKGKWTEANSGKSVTISDFKGCSAFWLTFP